jgi:hypothetical protein
VQCSESKWRDESGQEIGGKDEHSRLTNEDTFPEEFCSGKGETTVWLLINDDSRGKQFENLK